MAIILGIWLLTSIILTPLIGYFLFRADRPGRPPIQVAPDSRYRAWNSKLRRQGYSRRTGFAEVYRHDARGPLTGTKRNF